MPKDNTGYNPDGVPALIHAVLQVLEDDETGAGGWGPDVTMVAVLHQGLKAVGLDPNDLPAGTPISSLMGKLRGSG